MAHDTTFADHIRELRTRFFAIAAVFLVASSVAYVYRDHLMTLLLGPLEGQKLLYLTPAGGFTFIFLVSIYVGLALTIPMLLYQVYCFARPALPSQTQKYGGKILLLSLVLLASGVLFGYVYAVPGALRFLSTFAGDYVESALTADSYLNFIVGYTVGLGAVFQLPLVLFIIHKIKPLTPGGLLKSERWVVLFAFIAAAIITPTPDPLNQTIIALPVIFIYQLGVAAVLISIHRSKKTHKAKTPIRTHEAHPTVHEKKPVVHEHPVTHQQAPQQPARAPRLTTEPIIRRIPQPAVPSRSAPRVVVMQRPPQPTTERRTVDGFALINRSVSQYSSRTA